MDRFDIRLKDGIKDSWKEESEREGFDTLTDFVIDCVTERIMSNIDKLSDLNREVIIEHDRERKLKKIRYLQKANRSEAFEVSNYIKNILRKYRNQEKFIDEGYLIRDLKLQIERAKLCDNPKKILLNILPELRNNGWRNAEHLIEVELIQMGATKEEIQKSYEVNTNSISLMKHIVKKRYDE